MSTFSRTLNLILGNMENAKSSKTISKVILKDIPQKQNPWSVVTVTINDDNISQLSSEETPYPTSKSRSESCLSGYFSSGANGALSVNTAYSELE